MKIIHKIWLISLVVFSCNGAVQNGSKAKTLVAVPQRVKLGAEVLLESRLWLLKDLRVGLVANQASLLPNNAHILDALLNAKVNVTKLFAPEHGFRGTEEAGDTVSNALDKASNLPIVSLYGKKVQPSPNDLADIDAIVFDIQDVGARFYTYTSTLSYLIEACAKNDKQLIVLDRPNPNANFVAGPVLEPACSSFVGLHPIPIVYGMTIGELGRMINHQKWTSSENTCKMIVIPMEGYSRAMTWQETQLPWRPPSPNLQTPFAATLYPILCWHEGTKVSVGRGTDKPFTLLGFPYHLAFRKASMQDSILKTKTRLPLPEVFAVATHFTPKSLKGKSMNPMYKDQTCWGIEFQDSIQIKDYKAFFHTGLQLLRNFYLEYQDYQRSHPEEEKQEFFNPFFKNLVGNTLLAEQIRKGETLAKIQDSWELNLNQFKKTREQYLLYK